MPRKPSTKVAPTAPVADLTLPARLDMRHARQLKSALDELMPRSTVMIDGACVNRVSTGCAQVIASFALTKSRAGHVVTIRRPSAVITIAFADLGLELHSLVKEQR